MTIKQRIQMIRIADHDAEPMDISIDLSDGDKPMFFEIEQDVDRSIVVSIKGLEALIEAAKKLEEEYRK